MHNLSCFPTLSQSIISILIISEFNDFIGIRKYSSQIGFKHLSILLLFAEILVFNIVNKQYGSLNPFVSAEGRFKALIKCILISHFSFGGNSILSSIISPSNALLPFSTIFISVLINPVIFLYFELLSTFYKFSQF